MMNGFGYDLDKARREGNIFERVFHNARLRFWLAQTEFRGKKVLDVGCNTGILLIPLLKKGAKAVGVDISKEEVSKTKDNLRAEGYPSSLARVANAKKLPFKTNTFDLVLLSDILEHVSNPKKVVLEAIRVTKEGGHILVTVPNEWHPVVKYSLVRKILSGRKNVDQYPDIPFNLKKLIALFPRVKVVDKRLIGFFTEIYCRFEKQ